MAARDEMLRVQALHQEIAEQLRLGLKAWVRRRFEDNFMSHAFHTRCVADYERWIKEWDAMHEALALSETPPPAA
jgi:hypothetical protein